MPDPMKLTMQQLAQMALGTDTLNSDNITILHYLIQLLLKKLNSTQETVSIGGFESKCLEKLLEQTSATTLPFDDQAIDMLEKKYARIVKLEERINSVSAKLEKHYEEIRHSANYNDTQFQPLCWQQYALNCEDVTTEYEPENEIAYNLLSNPDFVKKLQQITKPMIERIQHFEKELDMLHCKFKKFLRYSEQQYKKVGLVECLIGNIEKMKILINTNQNAFEETISEINAMLHAKVEKQHLPIIKRAIAKQFEEELAVVTKFQKDVETAKLNAQTKLKITEDKCLSCGRTYAVDRGACADELSESKIPEKAKSISSFCGCDGYSCLSRKRYEPKLLVPKIEVTRSKQMMEISHQMMRKNLLFKMSVHSMLDSY